MLDALKRECVRASFFLLGRNALAHPELAAASSRRATPSPTTHFRIPLLDRMPLAAAEAEIDRGFAAVDAALYGRSDRVPQTPFFRFPGFASSPALLDRLERRGIAVFGADLWASDWDPMSPRAAAAARSSAASRPIAAESCCSTTPRRRPRPCFRPSCGPSRNRGYRVVHVVPASR